jgi:hypothetical protein
VPPAPSAAAVGATAEWLANAEPSLADRVKTKSVAWVAAEGVTRTLKLPPGFSGIYSRLPQSANGAWEVGANEAESLRVAFVPQGASAAALEMDGKRAVYREAWKSTDAVYVNGSDFAELLLVLREPAAPAEFRWQVRLPERIKEVRPDGEGGLAFADAQDRAVLRMPRAFAVDANGQRREASFSWEGQHIALRLDRSGLAFPVLLDPIVELAVWTNLRPRPRNGHAMATLGSSAVLFGGTATSNLGDTWEWDGARWKERYPVTSPPARNSHAMASLGSKVVLFGGRGSSPWLADTWEWDGTAWTQRTPPTSPPARCNHAMATLGGKVVLFGGNTSSGNRNDTWEWDGTTWNQRTPAAVPPARSAHAMVALGGKVVLFGGTGASGDLADTWEWDGANWTQRSPSTSPPARALHAMAPLGGTVGLFGGRASGTSLGDTWVWDGTTWIQAMPPASPAARTGHAMATVGSRVLLWGGIAMLDVWEWDGTAWTMRDVAPSGRYLQAVATLGSKVVLFGGRTAVTYYSDGGIRLAQWQGNVGARA